MKEIQLTWNAPGLANSAAISGSMISPSGTQKIILPANQPINLQVDDSGPVTFQGQMPSGQLIQTGIHLQAGQVSEPVTIQDPNASNDPELSLLTFLGSYTVPLAEAKEQPLFPRDLETSASKGRVIKSTQSPKWENLWLRIWSFEKDAAKHWQPHSLVKPEASFRGEALILKLCSLPKRRPCFLELGNMEGLSHFVAVPPIEFAEVVIRPTKHPLRQPVAKGMTIKVISPDPCHIKVQVALKYIQGGAFADAENLIEDMHGLMIEKVEDPFGAAVGGYFLLKIGQGERIREMARNFYQWIDWLPDSALIYAWQLMSQDVEEPAWVEHIVKIKKALLDGVSRGVPIFSFGQRFLFEQLRRLERQLDEPNLTKEPIASAVGHLGERLGASDENQFMTTFFGTAPWRPTMIPDSVEMDDNCFQLGPLWKAKKQKWNIGDWIESPENPRKLYGDESSGLESGSQ